MGSVEPPVQPSSEKARLSYTPLAKIIDIILSTRPIPVSPEPVRTSPDCPVPALVYQMLIRKPITSLYLSRKTGLFESCLRLNV